MSSPASIILPYRGILPKIDPRAFVAPGAVVIGDVEIGPESSIWFGCVLRGDVNKIRIGARTNIQDGTVIHTAAPDQPAQRGARPPSDGYPTLIGDNVTVGHMVLLHACTIETDAFVGMRSTVMDGCVIETRGMIAAGALLTPGKTIKKGQLWAGTPAKYWRDLAAADFEEFKIRADQYAALGQEYLKELA